MDLCMQVGPSHCHIVRGREHDDISQSQGEERENTMSPGGSRCRERNERSPNMTGFTAVSKSLLHLVHQSFCCTTFPPPQSKCILNPHHIGILFYLPRSPSLHPSYPSFITAALPSDIDLGRVATAALQLNTPEALRKAQMRCGAMDHIDLWSTVLILGSATAPSLSGHMCHSSPML